MSKRLVRFAPLILYSVIIYVQSAQSQAPVPDLGFTWQDKVYHVCGYGLYGLLTQYALAERPRLQAVVLTLLIGAVYGALDEWHQSFVPGRSSEIADWLADLLGIVLSCVVVSVFQRSKSKL